jgi:hypothetical protein
MLGGLVKLFLGAAFCVAAACLPSCASQSALSGQARDYAESCREWMTIQLPPRIVRRVYGFTRLQHLGGERDPLPGVDVVLIKKSSGHPKHMVRSTVNGTFDFGRIDSGTYILKTCLDGFNTVEVEVTVSPSAAAVDPLYLDISPGA